MAPNRPQISRLEAGLGLMVGVNTGLMTGDVVIFAKDVTETIRSTNVSVMHIPRDRDLLRLFSDKDKEP
jgi:hypothetical protein